MAPTGIDCDRCGNRGFQTKAGLASHQRSSYCWNGVQRQAVYVSKKPKVTSAEVAAQGHATIQDGASVHLNILRNDEVVGSEVNLDYMFLEIIDQRCMSDSTLRLVDFIRSCNNGKGLSKQDTQDLLDLLFDPRFDIKALTVKSAEDVARYEETLKTLEDEALLL